MTENLHIDIWGWWCYSFIYGTIIICVVIPTMTYCLCRRLFNIPPPSDPTARRFVEEENTKFISDNGSEGDEKENEKYLCNGKKHRRRRRLRKREAAAYTNLPESVVVTQILSRLPVKSLMRFRCVSKSWNSLILNNPNFISLHLNNYYYSTRCPSNLIVNSIPPTKTLLILSFHNKGNAIRPATMTFRSLDLSPYILDDDCIYPRIIGSCRGILCMRTCHGKVVLFNPITKDFKTIPSCHPRPENDPEWGFMDNDPEWRFIRRFGFDSITSDYKLLEIFEDDSKYYLGVYTLRTDSWRKLEDDVLNNVKDFYDDGRIVADRYICWLASIRESKDEVLVYFDMCDDIFRIMQLPPDIGVRGGSLRIHREMISWHDQSVAVVHKTQVGPMLFDIWVMKEFGVEESWTKLVTVGPLSGGGLRPLGFWKNGEFILQKNDYNLVFYNSASRQIRDLGISGAGFHIYKESLVSVSGNSWGCIYVHK